MLCFIHISGDLPLGDLLVGAGTLLLAGFTWQLARQTKRDVALTRESLDAADMPYIIPTPDPLSSNGIEWRAAGQVRHLVVRLWNLGKGPAMVCDVRLTVGSREIMPPLNASIPVHAGGVSDQILEGEAGSEPRGEGVLRVYYRHASGKIYVTVSPVRIDEEGSIICLAYPREAAASVRVANAISIISVPLDPV